MPKGAEAVVVAGVQMTFQEIQEMWQNNFFNKPKDEVCQSAKKYLSKYLMTDYDVSHFEALHDLGYLPIEVKSLEEGTITTAGIPLFTIKNTHPNFFWITNFLETLISTLIWKPVHSASLAYAYKKVLTKYAKETDPSNLWFVDFQAHDFSLRGMQALDAGTHSGIGFATSFKGSDTIPILEAVEHFYGDDECVYSVNATEHSVMCSGSKEGEIETFRRLMKTFPKGILSVVSDTWDLWKVLTEYLPTLKEEILARDGKLVIRPDSGDPVEIICGYKITADTFLMSIDDILPYYKDIDSDVFEITSDSYQNTHKEYCKIGDRIYEVIVTAEIGKTHDHNDNDYYCFDGIESVTYSEVVVPAAKGLIELLWDTFGGTVNEQGFKVLDSHIGAIYGDSITLERAEQICERLKAKGFASTNIVFGVGSYSMGYATRDNQGGAVKSTYVEINGVGVEIFKDPVTDDGTKKSAKGLLKVSKGNVYLKDNPNIPIDTLVLFDQQDWENERKGILQTIFLNGQFIKRTSLADIRERINKTI